IMGLLAAEITARTGRDPGIHFEEITQLHGEPFYRRVDQPATPAEKNILKKLSPESVKATTLAGEPILAKLTTAPGNNAPIGGLKVVALNGWFAARPARRTFTRFMRRASRMKRTWSKSWRRRGRW